MNKIGKMNKFYSYLAIAIIGVFGCSVSMGIGKETCGPRSVKLQVKESSVRGLSADNPIVFAGVKEMKKQEVLENEYLEKNYPGYQIKLTVVFPNQSWHRVKQFELIKDEETVNVFFDQEEAVSEYEKKNDIKIKADANKLLRKYVKEEITPSLDGTSFKRAIPIKNIKTEEEIEQQEKNFLDKNYPDYEVEAKEIWFVENKFLERIRIRKGDEKEIINFDISEYMKRHKNSKNFKLQELYHGAYLVEVP